MNLGGGAEAKIKLFQNMVMLHIKLKADDAGSNMVANILPTDTPLTQGVGSKGQTIYFSEKSHVAYQIKADDAGSNMVANVLPTDTPSTQGVGSKGQTKYFSAGFIRVREMSGKFKSFQGQGIVREFYVVSGKNECLLKCQGNVREFSQFPACIK